MRTQNLIERAELLDPAESRMCWLTQRFLSCCSSALSHSRTRKLDPRQTQNNGHLWGEFVVESRPNDNQIRLSGGRAELPDEAMRGDRWKQRSYWHRWFGLWQSSWVRTVHLSQRSSVLAVLGQFSLLRMLLLLCSSFCHIPLHFNYFGNVSQVLYCRAKLNFLSLSAT